MSLTVAGLTMAIWALIGLAYPLYNAYLPYILATRGYQAGDGSVSDALSEPPA